MIVRIIGLVFLFIISIRFSRVKSDCRYGEYYAKKIQRFKKWNFILRKCHLDLAFLSNCKKNGVISKFIWFKLANRHLTNSHFSHCKNKSSQSKRRSIHWKRMHRGLRKNYKEEFLF